jgi:succinate-acetate transporter protein
MAQVTSEAEQVAAAPAAVANATPLGLFSFAITLFVLSLINAGFLADAGFAIVIGLALFLGGLVLLLVGMWEFRAGNNFTATVFSSFAAFWLSFGFLLLPGTGVFAALVGEKVVAPAIGAYLLAWTIYVALLTICVLRTNVVLIAIFVFLLLTFLALTIGFLAGVPTLNTIGGYLGIITGILAFYLGFAGILPYINPGIKLPVGPIS